MMTCINRNRLDIKITYNLVALTKLMLKLKESPCKANINLDKSNTFEMIKTQI